MSKNSTEGASKKSSPSEQSDKIETKASLKASFESYKNSLGPTYTGLVLIGFILGIVITSVVTLIILNGENTDSQTSTQAISLEAKERCEREGGIWELTSRGYVCDYVTDDQGDSCTSNSDCSGWCLADDNAQLDTQSEGECSENKIVEGCFKYMDNRKVNSICLQ